MFNKILSNLPFEPGYPQTLTRFREEESRKRTIRGAGVLMIALALVVQVFAFVGAPKTGASGSPNDLLPGGVGNKQQLYNACNSNSHGAAQIYSWYGVSCANIANGTPLTLISTDHGGQLWSVGHSPYNIAGETPVNLHGATLYWRLLHGWDTHASSSYQAIRVSSATGRTYYILYGCGNLVSVGFPTPYTPPAPKPAPKPTPAPKPCVYNNTLPASSPLCKPPPKPTPCPYNSLIPKDSPLCKPCSASKTVVDTLNCLSYGKAASNLTQGIADANNTTANPGDTIQYTLKVTNNGKAAVKDFIIQENLNDVLIYADTLNLNGGTVIQNGILSWPGVTVPANGSVTKVFTIKVKSPLPALAPLPQDPKAHDNVLTNIYGNTINVTVKQPAAVAAAVVLPNTGPGAGVIIMTFIMVLAGYFYFRSRLLIKEAGIVQSLHTLQLREVMSS